MLKVMQIGLGPLGQNIVRYLSQREGLQLVGAVDIDPNKVGSDLGELCNLEPLGMLVSGNLTAANPEVEVAVLATVSGLAQIEYQIMELAENGLNIVTTCEELSHPWNTNPEIARNIDRICKENNVAWVGTGVNPGFLMEYLPTVLTSVCQNVGQIRVERIQDASARRIPFQQKIGAGLTLAEFDARVAAGTLRHVGLPESVYFIADSLNWKLDDVQETLAPVIAKEKITSGYKTIEAGQACGVEQIGIGLMAGREVIRLRFRAAVGEPEPADTIEIIGSPNIKSTIPGGIHGDIATCAITVNALRAITKVSPGLKTMLDLPVAGYFTRFVS